MRTKVEQKDKVRLVRGVRRDHLFACLGQARPRRSRRAVGSVWRQLVRGRGCTTVGDAVD